MNTSTSKIAPVFAKSFSDTRISGKGGTGLFAYAADYQLAWTTGDRLKPHDLSDVAGVKFDPQLLSKANPLSILGALSSSSAVASAAISSSDAFADALTAGALVGTQRQCDLVSQLRRDAVNRHRSRIGLCCAHLSRAWQNTQAEGPLLSGIYAPGASPFMNG